MANAPSAHARRLGYALLGAVPFLAVPLAAIRSLRVPGLHHAIGAAAFAAICIAAWILVGRVVRAGAEADRRLALAGGLLIVPFALIALLWVGLGTPWDASPPENQMRYLVLLASCLAVTGGFVFLKDCLCDAGERLYSTAGFAGGVMAGAAYLVWLAFMIGAWSARVRTGESPASTPSLNDALDTLLFVACVLTYIATAAFAASLRKTRWLGGCASLVFVLVSLVALLCIFTRGLSYPDPTASSTPWYLRPGFIAGIPAIPWIVPHLLGVALLRRASSETSVAPT